MKYWNINESTLFFVETNSENNFSLYFSYLCKDNNINNDKTTDGNNDNNIEANSDDNFSDIIDDNEISFINKNNNFDFLFKNVSYKENVDCIEL